MFEAFFGGGAGSRGPIGRVRPGSDSLLRMRLDLTECATGVTKQVTVDTAMLCDLCQGKGTHGNSTPVTCDTCGGHGEVQSVQRSLLGQVMTSRPCPVCGGVGEVIPDPCHRCGGDGRVRARREISVKIPAGVGEGMRVRLAAQGEVGPGGGPAGDLYVEVHEQPHDIFVRDGDDLHCTVSVPMVDAALGTSVIRRRHHRRAHRDHHRGGHPAGLGRRRCAATACRTCAPACAATCTPTSTSWCRRGSTTQDTELLRKLKEHRVRGRRRGEVHRSGAGTAAGCSAGCARRSPAARAIVSSALFYVDALPDVGGARRRRRRRGIPRRQRAPDPAR